MFALDFALDSVRHSSLLDKVAKLRLPDEIYDWLCNFFQDHCHCTKFSGVISTFINITASVIQGSSIDLASFTVTASDLQPLHKDNAMVEFADDIYLIIPEMNSHTCVDELELISTWAKSNNLALNLGKSKEIIFQTATSGRQTAQQPNLRYTSQ